MLKTSHDPTRLSRQYKPHKSQAPLAKRTAGRPLRALGSEAAPEEQPYFGKHTAQAPAHRSSTPSHSRVPSAPGIGYSSSGADSGAHRLHVGAGPAGIGHLLPGCSSASARGPAKSAPSGCLAPVSALCNASAPRPPGRSPRCSRGRGAHGGARPHRTGNKVTDSGPRAAPAPARAAARGGGSPSSRARKAG